jgi:hypothetical protein
MEKSHKLHTFPQQAKHPQNHQPKNGPFQFINDDKLNESPSNSHSNDIINKPCILRLRNEVITSHHTNRYDKTNQVGTGVLFDKPQQQILQIQQHAYQSKETQNIHLKLLY